MFNIDLINWADKIVVVLTTLTGTFVALWLNGRVKNGELRSRFNRRINGAFMEVCGNIGRLVSYQAGIQQKMDIFVGGEPGSFLQSNKPSFIPMTVALQGYDELLIPMSPGEAARLFGDVQNAQLMYNKLFDEKTRFSSLSEVETSIGTMFDLYARIAWDLLTSMFGVYKEYNAEKFLQFMKAIESDMKNGTLRLDRLSKKIVKIVSP